MHVDILLSADLQKWHSERLSHLLPILEGDPPIIRVALVPHQHLDHVLTGVGLDLFEPVLQGVKGSQVVD